MSTLLWKRRLACLSVPFSNNESRRIILLYHSIGDGPLAVSEHMFRQQISWLKKQVKIVSLDAITSKSFSDELEVAITFDDGYSSLHDRAAPILAEYGATATVYLNTGWIGETERKTSVATLGHYEDEQFLIWKEVKAMHQAGWIIGSHGVDHLDLTRQESTVIGSELENSKRNIEDKLGVFCKHFAYTWGNFNPELQQRVQAAGYISAVSGLHAPVRHASNIFALPRIDIRAEYELGDFQNLVSGHWDFLGVKQRLMRKFT